MIVLLLALFGVRAQAQSPRVWMDDMSIVADGQTATYMTVYMTDPDSLYVGFQMGITVPEGISIHQVKSGRVMVNDAKLNEYRFEGLGHSLIVSMADSKTIKVACADMAQGEKFYRDDADGNIVEELFTIGLVASPEMVNGEYTMEMWGVEMFCKNTTAEKPVNTNLTAKMTVTGGQDGQAVPYALTAAGYGTIILPFDAELPEGVKAFTCKALDGDVVVTEEQSRILANTPMLLQGTPGHYSFMGAGSADDDSYTEGVLTGVYPATTISSGYVLQTQQGVTGFYRVDANDPKTVPANRCYLTVTSNAKMISLDFADGIDGIMADGSSSAYDLNGRRVTKDARGVVVKEGRKVVNK